MRVPIPAVVLFRRQNTALGSFLSQRLGSSFISGSLLMYGSLIVGFIALEWVFLRTQDDGTAQGEEDI